MRFRVLAGLLIVALASLTLSLIRGQDRPAPLPTIISGLPRPSEAPAIGEKAAPAAPPEHPAPPPAKRASPIRDLSRLTPLQQQLLLGGQSGADWLYRMHAVKGRFVPGYLPALKREMEGDHFLRQAGAACALARAARFTGEERYAARATQAVLALLDDTTLDPKDPQARYTSMPPIAVDRLASAALLVRAVSELPAAQKDLHDRAEQLCNYIRKQARPSGALGPPELMDEEESQSYPGLALHALLLHHKHRPAGWKLDLARKALPWYRTWWKAHKSMACIPSLTAACAEAFLATRDKAFAEFAFEMSDWLCSLQYTQIEPAHLLWYGGFRTAHEGRAMETAPTVQGAPFAAALVEACRVAREVGDVPCFVRFSEAAERCLQFLSTMQYTEANTQHFQLWYRRFLLGGFHASHQDGNLRIDYTQHAVVALFGYLEHVPR
jgi:hypothetical protein